MATNNIREEEVKNRLRQGRNDFQNQNLVYLINRKEQMPTPRGWWVTPNNLIVISIFLAVRHCIEATWLNDRDQFLYPNDGWRADKEFQSDCLAYTLFSNSNNIKSAEGVNHWLPFTEAEVGAQDVFKSHFMHDYTQLVQALRQAVKALAEKIEPKVYEYGFLKK